MTKFRVRKFDLQNELTAITSTIDKKAKEDILGCAYLNKVDSNNLVMAASCRELMMRTSLKIDGSAEGLMTDPVGNGTSSFAVNASKLLELCKKLPDKIIEVSFDTTNLKAIVRCDSSRFTLSGLEPTLFPSLRSPESYTHKIPLRFFHGAIKNSLNLIESKEGTLVFYSGVLIILEDGVLEVIATDGHRLAVWFTTMETTKTFKVILPKKTLMELASTLEGVNDLPYLNLEITPNLAFISFGRYTYQSGILVGSFPNYRVIVDAVRSDNDLNYHVNRTKLKQAVERCLIFTDKDQGHGLNFEFKTKEVAISSANTRGESSFEVIEAECPAPLTMRLNGSWVSQYLDTIQDENIDLVVNSQDFTRPVYFKSQTERGYITIMQPMGLIG